MKRMLNFENEGKTIVGERTGMQMAEGFHGGKQIFYPPSKWKFRIV